jgi:WD40 repeat protein
MATDQYGARLPDGAVARFGIVRPGREGERISAVAFSPDGTLLATGGEDCTVCLWEVARTRERRRCGEHAKTVGALAFSPDGQLLASGSHEGDIALWDVATGRERGYFPAPAAGLLAIVFTPDGEALTALYGDEQYRSWDIASGAELGAAPSHLGPLYALAFAPEGTSVVTGGWESLVRLNDIETGHELRQFQGHRSYVHSVAISPDGRTIASGSPDETIRVWEVLTGRERLQFAGLREGIFALAFSPDGRLLASALNDTSVLLWDLTGRPVRDPAKTMVPLSAGQLEALWNDLGSSDVARAYRAVWGITANLHQTMPFVKSHIKLLVPADPQRVQVLLTELGHDQITRRDKASQDLEKLGALCEPALQAALSKKPSMDTRRRLEKLIARAREPIPAQDTLHALRLIEALELAGSAAARQLLQGLCGEKPPTRVTHEAQAALARLGRRAAPA